MILKSKISISFKFVNLLFTILFIQLLTCSTYASEDTSKVEWIKVYFNEASDHNYALPGNKSNDKWDMIGVLVEQIDAAKYSIDLAAYDLQNMRVGQALSRAKKRGLRVRVITDVINRNRNPRFNQPMWDTLRAAGIISFDDSGTIYWPMGQIEEPEGKLPNSGANMHHKFCVIDGISPNPDDMYLWTGTMNLTYTGPWNTNASILIKDSGITLIYLEEFNQMWGDPNRPAPNPKTAKFHKDKNNVSQNIFWVNDTKIEVYFGPMNRKKTKPSISERMTELITNYALTDIHFLAFAISSNIPMSQAMLKKSEDGEIILKGVIDPSFYSRYRKMNDIWASEECRSGNRMILPGKEIRKLHAKTLLIDAAYPHPEKHTAITVTGSYNFSKAAEEANDENILFIHSNEITNLFYQDFMGVMNRAQGITEHMYPTFNPEEWFDYSRVKDGQIIEVEFEPGLPYPVSLLGVKAPRKWAGHKDSTYYYSEEAENKLKELSENATIKVVGSTGKTARHKYGRYYAYVLAEKNGKTIHLNKEMIRLGYAQYDEYYSQHTDSAEVFKQLEAEAKSQGLGIWKNPHRIGEVILSSEAEERKNIFPININTATKSELEHLPEIGPGRAQSIIDYRESNGYFRSHNDINLIKGIGPETVKKIKPHIIFDIPEEH